MFYLTTWSARGHWVPASSYSCICDRCSTSSHCLLVLVSILTFAAVRAGQRAGQHPLLHGHSLAQRGGAHGPVRAGAALRADNQVSAPSAHARPSTAFRSLKTSDLQIILARCQHGSWSRSCTACERFSECHSLSEQTCHRCTRPGFLGASVIRSECGPARRVGFQLSMCRH